MKYHLAIVSGLALTCGMALSAEAAKDKSERKNITVITAQGNADGSTEISREAVKECIVTLPSAEALEPEVMSDSRFLKEINGDATKNEWAKVYTAKLTINYQVYKKDMLIVATKSVEGREPTLKELEKRLPQAKEFLSNPADGDTYAGRSNRQYYYTKAETAAADVKSRAKVWLKQQAPLLCTEGK
jgi:hypothetical protein